MTDSYELKPNETLLRGRDVAEMLGVCVMTVNRLRKSGALPALKFNSRMIRYDRKDVERYIESCQVK